MSKVKSVIETIKKIPGDSLFIELIELAEKGIENHEVAFLADALANSGVIQNFDHLGASIADIPSTGGPSSLSTLITPLFLKQFGCIVPKLGVPGRPAGGVDVLSQIRGYNLTPDKLTLVKWLEQSSYVHFVGNETYTPLDIQLFAFRKKIGKIPVPPLVTASILAKKIAVGLKKTGLDIRVSEFGNFGKTWNESKNNAKIFVEVASELGIEATCFLTNANQPFQPYIGRGEALLALKETFEGTEINWLKKHVTECFAMAKSISSINTTVGQLDVQKLENLFFENIKLQGGSLDSFEQLTSQTKENHNLWIEAKADGFVHVNLLTLRSAIVLEQARVGDSSLYPDPCGVILKQAPGKFVAQGEVLCTYRYTGDFENDFARSVAKAVYTRECRQLAYEFEEVK